MEEGLNVFNTLKSNFITIFQTNSDSHITEKLKAYLSSFPTRDIEKHLSHVPLRFHRHWIKTSINVHKRKVKKLIQSIEKGKNTPSKKNVTLALLWLEQAEKIFKTTTFFKDLCKEDITSHILEASDITEGDLVFSYKTKKYLKKSPLSTLVKYATNSQITHAMIACTTDTSDTITLLGSGDTHKGLGMLPLKPELGEVFLILRIQDTSIRERVTTNLEKWKKRAHYRTEFRLPHDEFSFPELKCQTASALGFIYVTSVYLFQNYALLPNPFKSQKGIFCSELIDCIFKEAGVYVSPRSEFDSIIGPIEIFYSPHLELKGVITQQDNIPQLQEEIRSQFIS